MSGCHLTGYINYNSVGQLLSNSQSTNGQTYSLSYSYNLAGSLTRETYPSGRVVTTGYDGANRPNQITGVKNSQATNYLTGLSYASHGAPASYLYGNALGRRYSYNTRLQPAVMSDALNNSDSNILLRLTWDWAGSNGANNGNLYRLTADQGGPGYPQLLTFNQNFGYDALNRLTTASDSGGWSRSFGYNQWGNMWVTGNAGAPLAGNTPTANSFPNNRLPNTTYDNAGNQLLVNGNTVGYDAENHQVSVTEPAATGGGTEYYYFDGAGQRIAKSGPGGLIVYVYDALGQMVAEYSSAAPPSTPCQTCYLSTDHLGNLRLVTDQAGNVVARHDYLPYGEETTVGRNGQWNSADNVNQKFTSQYHDSETGEDYFNARMFGSAYGRFTSPDPSNAGANLMNPQSWNAYSYVAGNPLVNVDPSGTNPCEYNATCLAGIKGCLDDVMLCRSTQFNSDPLQGIVGSDPFRYLNVGSGSGSQQSATIRYAGAGSESVSFGANYFNSFASVATVFGSSGSGLLSAAQPKLLPTNAPQQQQPSIGLAKVGKAALSCAADHYGLTALAGGVGALGLPIPKSWLGLAPGFAGASEYTSVAGAVGFKIFGAAEPRIGVRILGTTRLFGVVGRAAPGVSVALFAYDAAAIGYCTYQAVK